MREDKRCGLQLLSATRTGIGTRVPIAEVSPRGKRQIVARQESASNTAQADHSHGVVTGCRSTWGATRIAAIIMTRKSTTALAVVRRKAILILLQVSLVVPPGCLFCQRDSILVGLS